MGIDPEPPFQFQGYLREERPITTDLPRRGRLALLLLCSLLSLGGATLLAKRSDPRAFSRVRIALEFWWYGVHDLERDGLHGKRQDRCSNAVPGEGCDCI